MLDIEVIKVMLMEDTTPMLTESQLQMLANLYDNINEACYYGCLMKATSDEKITIGPISIDGGSNNQFWLRMADGFYRKFVRESSGRSITGTAMGRSDELQL